LRASAQGQFASSDLLNTPSTHHTVRIVVIVSVEEDSGPIVFD